MLTVTGVLQMRFEPLAAQERIGHGCLSRAAGSLRGRNIDRKRSQLPQQVFQLLFDPKMPKVWGSNRMTFARDVEKRQPVLGFAWSAVGKDAQAVDMLALEKRDQTLNQCRLACRHF